MGGGGPGQGIRRGRRQQSDAGGEEHAGNAPGQLPPRVRSRRTSRAIHAEHREKQQQATAGEPRVRLERLEELVRRHHVHAAEGAETVGVSGAPVMRRDGQIGLAGDHQQGEHDAGGDPDRAARRRKRAGERRGTARR